MERVRGRRGSEGYGLREGWEEVERVDRKELCHGVSERGRLGAEDEPLGDGGEHGGVHRDRVGGVADRPRAPAPRRLTVSSPSGGPRLSKVRRHHHLLRLRLLALHLEKKKKTWL